VVVGERHQIDARAGEHGGAARGAGEHQVIVRVLGLALLVAELGLQVHDAQIRGFEQRRNGVERVVVRVFQDLLTGAAPQVHVAAHQHHQAIALGGRRRVGLGAGRRDRAGRWRRDLRIGGGGSLRALSAAAQPAQQRGEPNQGASHRGRAPIVTDAPALGPFLDPRAAHSPSRAAGEKPEGPVPPTAG
jgi:hypothetical protein